MQEVNSGHSLSETGVRKYAKEIKKLSDDLTPEEVYQARLIVARQKFWTPEIEKLLRRWRRQINLRHAEHKIAEHKYSRRYYLLGVPASILSTIVASGVLTTFKNCNECTVGCIPAATSQCASDEWVRLVMGLVGVAAIVFTCMSLFMNYGDASSNSKNASDNFEDLTREIDSILDTPVSARGDPIATLQSIRAKFDDVSKKSPSISSEMYLEYRTLKEEKRKSGTGLTPPSPNQVTFGERRRMPNASTLAKILVDNIERDGQKQRDIEKKIVQENDYDTDEEGKEVAIGFDLEALRPEDILETEGKKSVQASLTRALEFELARMYPPAPLVHQSDPVLSVDSESNKVDMPVSPPVKTTPEPVSSPKKKKKKIPKVENPAKEKEDE